ncbi:MAG: two-component regulator propeller domain-containing protein [Anaerolineae bacterium]
MIRIMLTLTCLLILSSCTPSDPTPTSPTLEPALTPQPTATSILEPTSTATVRPSPTPIMRLDISDAPVQSWTDPNLVTGLLVHEDELWASTQSGIVRWDLSTGEMTRFSISDGLAAPATRGIALDAEGRIWIGYAGLDAWSAWDGDEWITYEERERAVEAHYDALLHAPHTDPRLWASRSESTWVWLPEIAGRVESYDGQRWRLYGEHHGVRSGAWLVAISPDGQVWSVGSAVSTVYEGQVYWDDHSYYSGMGGGCAITSGSVDAQGGLWLGYACESGRPGGLMYWDAQQDRWRAYEHALNPIIPSQVHWTHVSPDGTVWVGGSEAIIWKHLESPWQRLDVPGLTVHAIHDPEQGDLLWLGTDQGVVALSRDEGSIHMHLRVPAPPIPANVVDVSSGPDGTIWLATAHGVLAVDATTGKLATVSSDPATALATTDGEAIWIGGPEGVIIGRGDGSLRHLSRANVQSLALAPSGDVAVVCTAGGELARLGEDGSYESLGSVPSLFGATAKALAVGADGNIWVATGVGLGHIPPEGPPMLLTTDDGLPNNDVLALAWGPEGELWIGTRNGLARLRPDGRWTRFTIRSTEGGLRSMTVRDFAIDRDGVLWMATAAGLSSREPTNADWAYHDLAGAQAVAIDDQGYIWVGTTAGLTRVSPDAMVPVP